MSKSLREEIRAVLALAARDALAGRVRPGEPASPEDQAAQEPKEEAVQDTEFQEIVVTGSRIRRTEFDSPHRLGHHRERSQLAPALDRRRPAQHDRVVRRQVNDAFSASSPTAARTNNISLRASVQAHPGAGQRQALDPVRHTGATYGVDLTAIPSSIISRIEILKDGASSIYGADAVAAW